MARHVSRSKRRRADELAPTVLYFESGARFLYSGFLGHLTRSDNPFDVILVVDECDSTEQANIWNKCKNVGRRLALITIYNEFEARTGETQNIDVDPLPLEKTSAVIQSYRYSEV